MNTGVSVIIVNYNTKELTLQCVESLKTHTKDVSYEIILVDNASTDGSKDCFEKRDDIIYLYSHENLGFGRANNLGFSKASGKYLFLLNSDTILNNNAIKLFYDFMESAPTDIACCGSFLRNRNLEVIHSYGRYPTGWNLIYELCLFPGLRRLGVKLKKFDYPVEVTDNYYIVDYITGADLFIRKAIAERYGLFDPDFFMYYEHHITGYIDYRSLFTSIGNKPVVFTLHNENFFYGLAYFEFQLQCEHPLEQYYAQMKRHVLAQAKNLGIVMLSDYYGEKFKGHELLKGREVRIINNAVDTTIYRPIPKADARQRLADALCEVLSAADFFAMPSTEEAFALSPMQAMACGRPVVAFPVSGTSELINDLNGVICSDFTVEALQAGILTLMSRSYDAAAIRQDMATRFSPELIASKYCSLFPDLLCQSFERI